MKTFLISDLHLGHDGVYRFTHKNTGKRIRPWARSSSEGDELLKKRWNDTVSENDRVYILGDVAIPRKGLDKLSELNGRKILIRGNHDIFKLRDYEKYFDDVRGSHKLDDYILTHIPIHHDSVPRWSKGNIHGHLHSDLVFKKNWLGVKKIDTRYINVCVEHVNATPVDFNLILNGSFKNKLFTE